MTISTPQSSEALPWQGNSWLAHKFPHSDKTVKIRRILLLTGVSCILLGVFWTSCYTYLRRPELAAIYVVLTLIGIGAIICSRRYKYRVLVGIAHAIMLMVVLISAIDVPLNGVSRSAYVYFLPLAAGAIFVFGQGNFYMGTLFPILCLVWFVMFGVGAAGFTESAFAPPEVVRFLGGIANFSIASLLMACVLVIYRNDMNARISLARELVHAITDRQLLVLYQPQVGMDGKPTGAEALVRWQHPSRGLLSPDQFIPLAEESFLIRELGLEVLRQACELLSKWAEDPVLATKIVAVNVSPVQLQDAGFVSSVRQVLASTGANPARLELELTESALCMDVDQVREKMQALQANGVRWALDDFGTGFSSLAVLQSLPVQKLKIDRQFVKSAAESESAKLLLAKIIEIADVMGMMAIAEGIETRQQRDMLAQFGCREFQGFLYGRPQPVAALESMMRATAR
ncbi:EAL domain-containing protein [Alcaligenaceae bacterium SJ-26]|nr:EAL domain-containing protein [Alcaligenaceae bacterium SJ-26]